MPIRPELRHFYGPEWRKVTRPRILERAGNKCEACKVPNHTEVNRGPAGTWLEIWVRFGEPVKKRWRDRAGEEIAKPTGPQRKVRIVLTVAHLNHKSGDDRDSNLRAWCQWCHLAYDREHHHETRAARKDAARPIIVASQQGDRGNI